VERGSTAPERWRGYWPFAAVIVATIGLSLVARGPGHVSGDVWIAQTIQRIPTWIGDPLTTLGNLFGSIAFIICALIVCDGFLIAIGRRRDALALTLILAMHLLNTPIKELFDSPRPTSHDVTVTSVWDGLGFPSGHSMAAIQLSGGIALVLWPWTRSRLQRQELIAFAMLFTLLVGFARIYCGAHWPSDVLGGYLYGSISLFIVAWLRVRFPARFVNAPGPAAHPAVY
jgi:membrane-associated phospholipid phosphatase